MVGDRTRDGIDVQMQTTMLSHFLLAIQPTFSLLKGEKQFF